MRCGYETQHSRFGNTSLQYTVMKYIWRIIVFTKSLWRYYAAVSVFTILLAALSQLIPIFTKIAVDEMTKLLTGGQASIALVVWMAVLIFLTDFGQTILSNVGGYLGDILSAKATRFMSKRYYEHLLSLPQKYFDNELSGKIINRMSRGITQITNYIQIVSNNFLQFIFSTVFSLIIVFYYSWQVGLMLSLLYPIFIWLTSRTSVKWQKYQKDINNQQDIASGRFAEAIGQIKVVKSFRQQQHELTVFGKHFNNVVATTHPQSKLWHQQDIIRRSVLNLIFFAIYIYIFIETAHGAYTIGTMVLLIQYAQLIRIPIFSISFIVDQTQRTISNSKDFFDVMDEQPELIDAPDAPQLQVSDGHISFENVTFGYDAKHPVLKGLSFTLKPNSKLALVGESGEGKTTVTNLLLRLYDVSSGEIRIDGQDIRDVSQASLHQSIGVVFQDPALFSGTIRENIAYGVPRATKQQVESAAKAANAHEFISGFDKGYETEIGERGLKLSGGQKQRIAIARALLKDAPILILDEATSSLDTRSERMVQEALERLMKNRSTIIIAHRLSTIQSVDQIVTIRNGKADEIGSPRELASTDGIYAQLLKLQGSDSEATKQKLQKYDIKG